MSITYHYQLGQWIQFAYLGSTLMMFVEKLVLVPCNRRTLNLHLKVTECNEMSYGFRVAFIWEKTISIKKKGIFDADQIDIN